jgi:DinB superfamily
MAGSKKKLAARAPKKPDADASLRERLVELLNGGEAHVSIVDAVVDFPADKRGAPANGLPHTGWQLLEHIRITQWDILEFSRNAKHKSPDFPGGYWPKTPSPPSDAAWDKSVNAIQKGLRAMIALVRDPGSDLHAVFPWGSGQTLLREALLLADHNAYHTGQMVDLRRVLGVWNKS